MCVQTAALSQCHCSLTAAVAHVTHTERAHCQSRRLSACLFVSLSVSEGRSKEAHNQTSVLKTQQRRLILTQQYHTHAQEYSRSSRLGFSADLNWGWSHCIKYLHTYLTVQSGANTANKRHFPSPPDWPATDRRKHLGITSC